MHTIFLVHGMGSTSKGWSDELQDSIRSRYFDSARYRFVGTTPFDNLFRFVEINYNQHFDNYLTEARKQADNLSKWNKLVPNLDGGLFRVLDRIVRMSATAPPDNFLVTHLADVVMFMATDVGEIVKNDVVLQLTAELNKLNLSGDRWSVIAHSLGTRVMTEVLQAGFTSAPSLRSFGKARMVMMVSNVSRLLEKLSPFNAGDVYHNAVFPSLMAANGVCQQYVNCTHRLDPFAFIEEFDPPATFGDGNAFVSNAYHGVKLPLADLLSKNVHALEHYLEHPLVHTAMLQFLLPGSGLRGPTNAEMLAAMTDYHQRTLLAPITDVWRNSLANLKTRPFATIEQILDLWEAYGNLLP
jgi:hypothetical protein